MKQNYIKTFKDFLSKRGVLPTFKSLYRDNTQGTKTFMEYRTEVPVRRAVTDAFPFKRTSGVFNESYWAKLNNDWISICEASNIDDMSAKDKKIGNWFDGLTLFAKNGAVVTNDYEYNQCLLCATERGIIVKFSQDISGHIGDYGLTNISLAIDRSNNDQLIIVCGDTPTETSYKARYRGKGVWIVENKTIMAIIEKYVGRSLSKIPCKVDIGSVRYNTDKSKMALLISRKVTEL